MPDRRLICCWPRCRKVARLHCNRQAWCLEHWNRLKGWSACPPRTFDRLLSDLLKPAAE